MTYDKISKVLTTEEYDALVAAVENLNTLVTAFAVNLTVVERRSLLMVGKRNQAFAERALYYAKEQQNDWTLFNQLRNLVKLINPVTEKITDTYMAAGSEALAAARRIYGAAKEAAKANKPGTNAIVADLKQYFSKSRTQSSTTETQTTQQPAVQGTSSGDLPEAA
jgi:hypothetical protein